MQLFQQWFVLFVLWIYLLTGLILPKVSTTTLYLMLAIGLVAAICRIRVGGIKFIQSYKKCWILNTAWLGMLCAVVLSQISNHELIPDAYEFAIRFAAFPVILWLFQSIPARKLIKLKWAFIFIAIAGGIKTFFMTKGGVDRTYVNFMPIIAYTDLSMLSGAISILALGWNAPKPYIRRVETSLKLTAVACGISAPYLYQTRGAWLALPLFVLVVSMSLLHGENLKRQLTVALLTTLVLAGMLASTHSIQTRFSLVRSNLQTYTTHSNIDTSLGVRLQLWKGAWTIFSEHPIAGVTQQGFKSASADLYSRHIISEISATLPHSHNEVLFTMATFGIVGLIALIALYVAPASFYLNHLKHKDQEIRTAAAMGICLTLGYVAYGLVDVMFLWKECGIFYTITAAFFCAFIIQKKKLLDDSPPVT